MPDEIPEKPRKRERRTVLLNVRLEPELIAQMDAICEYHTRKEGVRCSRPRLFKLLIAAAHKKLPREARVEGIG